MSWVRLEDGFAEHPKVLSLELAQRWAWVELLCYCGRRRSGVVTPAVLERFGVELELFVGRGLLDRREGELLEVHDWDEYNGAKSGAQRTSEWRDRKYGPARYSHGGRRGSYASDGGELEDDSVPGSTASSVTPVTQVRRAADVSTYARAPHPTPNPSYGRGGQGGENELERLIALLGPVDDRTAARLEAYGRRAPAGELLELLERVGSGTVANPVPYVLGRLEAAAEGAA